MQETKVAFRRSEHSSCFELPTGSATKGLGVGKTWYKVPLWAQKSFGPWTTYGGGGETVFNNVGG